MYISVLIDFYSIVSKSMDKQRYDTTYIHVDKMYAHILFVIHAIEFHLSLKVCNIFSVFSSL